MKVHPAADRFPMLGAEELRALADDIRTNGLIHPIVTFDGVLLDGRNRFAACNLAKVEPTFEALKACESPTNYIISANIKRRHLTPVQCAAMAVDPAILDAHRAEAKARQSAAGARGDEGGRGNKKNPSSESSRKGSTNTDRINSEAVAVSAKSFGVCRNNAYELQRVQRDAPDVYEAAKRGEFPTVAAALIAAGRPLPQRLSPSAERPKGPPPSPPPPPPPPVPGSSDPRLERRGERDEQVRALHGEGLGPQEMAEKLGCSVATVYQAKRRLGLRELNDNPLRRLTDFAIEFYDTWEMALNADVPPWSTATPEHVAELTKHLKLLHQRTYTLIRRLNKEATGDHA